MMNNCLFPESRYKREWWMSLYEVITSQTSSPNPHDRYEAIGLLDTCHLLGENFVLSATPYFSTRYSHYPLVFISTNVAPYVNTNTYIHELFRMIEFRYRHEYIFPLSFYKDESVAFSDWSAKEKAEFYEKSNDFIERLLAIMEFTYERYSSLLNIYRDEEADLMAKVESITRFNDTPQNSGEFADDSHTTNITTSQNDYDTYMGRLREIQSYYANVLKDWSDEFSPLFIHGEGL